LNIKILVIGKIKENSYRNKIDEYHKWINNDNSIQLISLKERREKDLIKNISKHLSTNKIFLCLSEEGIQYNSKIFSEFIHKEKKELVFLVGGPDGCSETIKKKSDHVISLSNFTFPHEMAILILSEQIFRAISIHKGSKYHRE
jgi:23S rRNA (pseudouridine1915-N3)-methyltransferase